MGSVGGGDPGPRAGGENDTSDQRESELPDADKVLRGEGPHPHDTAAGLAFGR